MPLPSAPDATAPSAVVQSLALRLLPRAPELSAQLVDSIVARRGSYAAGAGPVPRDDLMDSCVTNIVRMVQALAGVVPAGIDPLDAARATGARRADQLVPLEEVLQSYRQCGRVVWDGLVTELQPDSDPLPLLASAGEVWSVIDVFSDAVGEGYRSREAERQRRDQRRRDALFVALIEGRHDGPAEHAAEALGLPAQGPWACVVAPLPAHGPEPLSGVRGVLAGRGAPSAWTHRGDELVGLVALQVPGTPAVLAAALRSTGARAGVSPAVDALRSAPEAHRLARLALRTLPPGPGVALLDERLPHALLAASPDLAARTVDRVLGPVVRLPAAEREVLLQTLRAYLDGGGSATAAGKALYCHRNTVLNRLQRLEELTGGTLRDLGHATTCVLALLALEATGP